MQTLWSLYNREEKLRIDDLKAEQVKIILLAIPAAKVESWYICRESDLHWQPLAAIPEFFEQINQIKDVSETPIKMASGDDVVAHSTSRPRKPVGPPSAVGVAPVAAPTRRPLFEEKPAETEKTASVMLENIPTRERRSARRFMRKLEFHIELEGQNFHCDTLDISMSGMSLTEPLPAWVGKSFRAELHGHGEAIGVFCAKVSDKKLRILEADSWELIRKWIVSW